LQQQNRKNATSQAIKQKHNKPLTGVSESKFTNVFRGSIETGSIGIVNNWNFAEKRNLNISIFSYSQQKCTIHDKTILMLTAKNNSSTAHLTSNR